MSTSRRNILAAAGAGLAAFKIASETACAAPNPDHEPDVAALIKRSADSNAALMRGDIDTYRTLIAYTDDFTLMSPFGGTPSRGSEYTPERMEAMGRFFKNGVFKQEVVQSYASADMVVLAIIERQNVEVGGLPAQEWPLRVTLVYRREGSEWRLAHRHADPLVRGISLEQAAALARDDTDRTLTTPQGSSE
jgi:ketosteroid isomerase-like protein